MSLSRRVHYRSFHRNTSYLVQTVSSLPGEFTVAIGNAITDPGPRDIDKLFGFRSNTDTLIVLESDVFDREAIDEYVFTVVATDSGAESSTANVTVRLTDFNDEAPNITNAG